MTQITLKPIRQQTTVTLLATLTDNGVKIDWSDLSVVKAYIYSESQRVVAGPCTVQVDGEDPTILRCVYDASKPQYLGTQKLVIYCEYSGQKNTYDKEAFVFVASTAATTDDGTTVGEDTTDVDITVEDVSSSILSGAIKAALDAAEFADETAESVQERADQDHTRAEEDHSTAASDHTRAAADHTVAAADHTQAAADHSLASADHVQSGLDHTQAAADHGVAVSDHGQAGQDHTRAESDHDTAASDHTKAGQDHTRAESDHTQAAADHTLAGTDHSTAAADHTQAASDHTAAAADHTLAAADHSTAAADHTQALADHQVMQGYDTRLTKAETDISQLGQEEDSANFLAGVGKGPIGMITSYGNWVFLSEPSSRHICVRINSGDTVKIFANSLRISIYALLASLRVLENNNADFVSGTSRVDLSAGEVVEFSIAQDCYLYVTISYSTFYYFPEDILVNGKSICASVRIDKSVADATFKGGTKPKDYSININSVIDYDGLLTGKSIHPVIDGFNDIAAAATYSGNISSTPSIQNIGNTNYAHFAFRVWPGDTVKILGSATNATDYVVAKSYTPGEAVIVSSSVITGRNRIAAGDPEVTFTVPDDATWVLISDKYSGSEGYKPRAMSLNGVDMYTGQQSLPSRVTTLEGRVLPSFVRYTAASNKFEFFSAVDGLYYSFIIAKVINAEIVQNVWRVTEGFKYSDSLVQLHRTIYGGENEFTAKYDGFGAYGGFVGGYHGGELVDGDLDCFVKFFLDGKLVTSEMLQSDFDYECQEFKYIEYTTMHKVHDDEDEPITGTPIFAHHLKETTIKDGKMSTRNVVIFDAPVTTKQYFSGLFCVAKAAAAYCFVPMATVFECQGDNGYINATDKDNPHITMWSPANNVRVELTSKYIRGIDWANVSQTERVWDRPYDSKYYRFMTSFVAKQIGDIIETEQVVSFR